MSIAPPSRIARLSFSGRLTVPSHAPAAMRFSVSLGQNAISEMLSDGGCGTLMSDVAVVVAAPSVCPPDGRGQH
jgi:hypothetical protein